MVVISAVLALAGIVLLVTGVMFSSLNCLYLALLLSAWSVVFLAASLPGKRRRAQEAERLGRQ